MSNKKSKKKSTKAIKNRKTSNKEELPDIRVGEKIIKPTKEQEMKLRSLVKRLGCNHELTRTLVAKIAGQKKLPRYVNENSGHLDSEEFRKFIENSKDEAIESALDHDPLLNEEKHSGKNNDAVNHPSHYTDGKIEVIDYIEDKKLNYHLGNAVKYISRAGKKDPKKLIEDLKKAQWYLNREIERLEKEKSASMRDMMKKVLLPIVAGTILYIGA